MADSYADPQTVRDIRTLASRPEDVEVTTRANCDLWAENLKKEDICDAIVDWIDAGEHVEQITTNNVPDHLGDPAYVMKPEIAGARFYVKVTIRNQGEWRELLLIISSHR